MMKQLRILTLMVKLLIDDLNKGRFQVTSFENKSLIEKISYQIANITNQPFNVSFLF